MIFLDYSGISMAAIFADKGFQDAAKNPSPESKSLLKHMIINSIRSYKVKNCNTYGELVICADGANNWRKSAFKYYKAKRKKSREESPVDWAFVFEVMNETLDDLRKNFPYKVLHVNEAEADDCIAVGVKWALENKVKAGTIFPEPELNLIISSDEDYHQLQMNGNVHQYSPSTKKWFKLTKDEATNALIKKLIKGDTGDGVPNCISDDSSIIDEHKRQKPVTQKLYDTIKSSIWEAVISGSSDFYTVLPNIVYGLQRNSLLIDFRNIPQEVVDSILEQINTPKGVISKMNMINYFMQNDMRHLMEVADQF